jgi:DNA polymerase bacteriophage-type
MSEVIVVLDFETANSICDLSVAGADAYWQHILTEIICLVYIVDDGEPRVWCPGDSIDDLGLLAAHPSVRFVSHGGFERIGWRHQMVPRYGFPPIPLRRWDDTLAEAAWHSNPLELEKLATVNDLPVQKDMAGRRHILSMSKVMTKTAWHELYDPALGITQAEHMRRFPAGMLDRSPKAIQRAIEYCIPDVQATQAAHRLFGPLPPFERRVWELDQKINERGIKLDLPYVDKCIEVIEKASVQLLGEFDRLTGGIAPTQVAKVLEWCSAQGAPLANLQKEYIALQLGGSIDDDRDEEGIGSDGMVPGQGPLVRSLPDNVRRVLQIRQTLGSASVKKLHSMRACVSPDGRARYLLQYHAAHPGRWGGRLFQPQNFPRGSLRLGAPPAPGEQDERKPPAPELVVSAIMTGEPEAVELILGAPAFECVISGLRHAMVAEEGFELHSGDYAGIEMRIDLALAGQHDKCEMLAAGRDVYCDMAEQIYHHPVTKLDVKERTIGKSTVLGDGFGMGADTFCRRYLPECQCKLATGPCLYDPQPAIRRFAGESVWAYRHDWAPEVPKLWMGLEDAAMAAMCDGREHVAYGIVYRRINEPDALQALLPSGQIIWYPYPRIEQRRNRQAWCYRKWDKGQWKQVWAWGGLLTENAVQGLARSLLCASMLKLEAEGWPLVLTCHDEDLVEMRQGADHKAFLQIMRDRPQWAADINVPIGVDSWYGKRYRK